RRGGEPGLAHDGAGATVALLDALAALPLARTGLRARAHAVRLHVPAVVLEQLDRGLRIELVGAAVRRAGGTRLLRDGAAGGCGGAVPDDLGDALLIDELLHRLAQVLLLEQRAGLGIGEVQRHVRDRPAVPRLDGVPRLLDDGLLLERTGGDVAVVDPSGAQHVELGVV